jgi:hypothetical protein
VHWWEQSNYRKNGRGCGLYQRVGAVLFCSRCVLVAKTLERDLKTVLDVSVKIVNHIKFRSLKASAFKLLCEEMGSEQTALLLHTAIRWLARGKVLVRVFEVRSEIYSFCIDRPFYLSCCLVNTSWLQKLACLADIFTRIN